ncbi:MAG: hypothetical protein WD768_09810 [Phycisphaeraceae bacterium]
MNDSHHHTDNRNDGTDTLDDDERVAVERELARLAPQAVSSAVEVAIARAIAPAPAPIPLAWRPARAAWVAIAACAALAFVWFVSRPSTLTPPLPPSRIVQVPDKGDSPAPGPSTLFQLHQALAHSDQAAMKAIDAAAHPHGSNAEQGKSVLRAWSVDDVNALLEEL